MRDEISAAMAANMIAMMRAGVDGAIWVVDDEEEGRFYERLANEQGRVIPAFGGAATALHDVMQRGVQGIVGIVHDDHSHRPDLPLFRPDAGDAASVLLASKSADGVLGEVGGAAWLTACGRDVGGLLPWSIDVARRLAAIAAIGGARELPLECVNWSSGSIDAQRVADLIGEDKLSRLAEPMAAIGSPPCSGMNVLSVIAAATRLFRPRGLRAYRAVDDRELLSILRASFALEEFEAEGLYWRLKRWQWENPRYGLMRQWRALESFGILADQRYIVGDIAGVASTGLTFSLLQLDLDHFKSVNDTLGHLEGDEAIRMVERTLLSWLQGRGEAYRRGGDEMVALVVGVPRTTVEEEVERLRLQIERMFREWPAGRELDPAPTASIGGVHASPGDSSAVLIEAVETAQLTAKRNGKNRVVFAASEDVTTGTLQ